MDLPPKKAGRATIDARATVTVVAFVEVLFAVRSDTGVPEATRVAAAITPIRRVNKEPKEL
jgi:hypothetical protein